MIASSDGEDVASGDWWCGSRLRVTDEGSGVWGGLVLQPEFVILLVRAARGRLEPAGRQGDHR